MMAVNNGGPTMFAGTQSFPVGPSIVGPLLWRENTLRGIQDSNKIISRSDCTVAYGRGVDPLHHIRDILAEMSNDDAIKYARETRLIVHRLRQSIIDTNEEIKSLNRIRQNLEQLHEHMRKDLKTNIRCQETRLTRPARELCNDGTDDLISAEHVQVDNLRKMLEAHLKLVLIQLQTLDAARRRLTAAYRERHRVIDLISYAVPCTGQQSKFVRNWNFAPEGPCKPSSLTSELQACSEAKLFPVQPFGPYTNECDDALEDGRITREHSVELRQQGHVLLARVDEIQKITHQTLNRALMQKISESKNLRVHLHIAIGENRHTTNKSQRYFDKTEHAYFRTQGPESTHNLLVHEQLNRPIVKTLQRHPNNNLPETQEVIRAADSLMTALNTGARNIGQLRHQHQELNCDARDKTTAINIDDGVLRMRRRRYPHRWVMGGVKEHSWF